MPWLTRIGAILLAALAVPADATGQGATTAPAQPGQAGVLVGGVSSTLVSASSGDDFTGAHGFGAGVFFAPRISDRVSLELDGLVVEKGATNHFSSGPQVYTLRVFELPVLAHVSLLSLGPSLGVYALGGLALDVRLKYSRTVPPALLHFGTDLSSAFKTFGLDAIAGAGFTISRLRLEARYGASMRDINTTPGRGVRSRAWSVLFGYQIF